VVLATPHSIAPQSSAAPIVLDAGSALAARERAATLVRPMTAAASRNTQSFRTTQTPIRRDRRSPQAALPQLSPCIGAPDRSATSATMCCVSTNQNHHSKGDFCDHNLLFALDCYLMLMIDFICLYGLDKIY
jgi:hypothetical protein